ncbi:MAG: DUF2156 domain-containing protein [Solirubrobacteraceae bacterium]|nr:DUF2156 domain-containing protein [Patulibacter sp.]
MTVAAKFPTRPRASRETRIAFGIALLIATLNLAASLAMTPSDHLQDVAARVQDSRLAPAVAGGKWDLIVAVALFALSWGIMRRRAAAWGAALGMLTAVATLDVIHHEAPLEVAFPVVAIVALMAVRRKLVARPYRTILQEHMLPTADAFARTATLLRDYGKDTLAPFKLRPDVGHLFSDRGDAVLAFRVDNRSMLVAGDPVGSRQGVVDVVRNARTLSQQAGLRFGVLAASAELGEQLTKEFGMKAIYLGCEAIVETDSFTLQGHKIKKVRQAHRRVEREGYTLELQRKADLSEADQAAMRRCRDACRAETEEQSFSMAPESLESAGCDDSLIAFARHEETGDIGGLVVFMPLKQRSLWSLALQLRDPAAPNGVIDALLVHTLQQAKEQGVAEVSLNFASARRYYDEEVEGFWPNVARILANLAMRWTQIDALRFHNEKFSPRWDQRYMVVDSVLHLPHLVFATIWQEGQLPRPDAFLSPAWPASAASQAAAKTA